MTGIHPEGQIRTSVLHIVNVEFTPKQIVPQLPHIDRCTLVVFHTRLDASVFNSHFLSVNYITVFNSHFLSVNYITL